MVDAAADDRVAYPEAMREAGGDAIVWGAGIIESEVYGAVGVFVGSSLLSSIGRIVRGGRHKNVLPSSGRVFVGTPGGQTVAIPKGWVGRAADSGKGIVYQRPGATGNADMIRIMDPTSRYPSGYARYFNQHGQPLDVFGKPGSQATTHIPLDYQGPIPGWPQ